MIVVSDTTPVTTLLKCGEEHLLQQLFGTVIVPQAVWDELIRFHPRPPAFVSLHQVETPDRRLFGTEHLGRGEAEALKLAMQIQADLLLCDDKQARRAADALKIPVMGLIGVTLSAKQFGKIASARALIDKFQEKGGLYLSESVKSEALRAANEE